MSRSPQRAGLKGSQKWIQKLVNETPELLNSEIKNQLALPVGESITWLSPKAEVGYAEYRDKAFLDLLDLKLPKVPLADFWPTRGPQWDALGKSETGKVLLIESGLVRALGQILGYEPRETNDHWYPLVHDHLEGVGYRQLLTDLEAGDFGKVAEPPAPYD